MKAVLARAAVLGTIALGPLLLAAPAFAHVTVSSANATQGGYAKLTFRVPNEKDNADTTKLEVSFPTESPFAFVSVKPHSGWDYTVTKSTLATPLKDDDGNSITEAVSAITWTAQNGAALKPGTFEEFDISLGPLPSVASLTFKALQSYSDGEVVRWIQTTDGAEHPAPTIKLAPAAATGEHAAHASASAPAAASPTPTSATTATAADSSDSDATARTLGIIGIAIGASGLVAAVASRKKQSA